ncbi:MAG: Ig-like domain-containing protein, partial [Silanimonas sp.]
MRTLSHAASLLALVLAAAAGPTAAQVVVSQVYGAGGNAGATFNRDFVELFNRGSTPASLSGLTVQYASATGTGNFSVGATLPNVSLQPGGYYLVGMASGPNGAALPTVDVSGTSSMATAAGKVVLVNSSSALACNGGSTPCSAAQLALIVDLVGYGSANFFEGSAATPAPGTTLAVIRGSGGCTDANQNGSDFAAATPAPRNSATAAAPCGGSTPTLSIADASVAEGNSGTTTLSFTASLSAPAGAGGVSFDIATADGTASAGSDYVAQALTGQTIPAGSSTYTFTVTVNGDALNEADETFQVNVTNVAGATVGDGQAIGTISNDDAAPLPALTIADASVAEGNSGTTTLSFTASLSAPAGPGGVTFDIATADGTASAGSDYVAQALTGQTIPAGSSTYTFTVAVNGDALSEADETLLVNVTNVAGATVADGQATGTIGNDDAAPLPTLTIADVSVVEGNAGTTNARFTVSLSSPAPAGGVTFDVATTDGTATAGSDFVALALTGQTIAAGASSAQFDVVINGDTLVEPNETYTVALANVTGATVVDGSATGTISNDDVATVAIHAVQGSGSQSPLVGTDLTVEGIVTARKNNGFFVQSADANADADPSTSEGIFVFTSTTPPADAAVGNRVRVFGRVAEFAFSNTVTRSLPSTQIAGATGVTLTVTLVAASQSLPTPIDLQASDLSPTSAREAMERFEGMRVRAPSLVTVAPTSANVNEPNATASGGNGVFFATLAGVPRPLREPGLDPDEVVATTAAGTIPRFDNNPEMISIDSDGQVGAANVRVDTGAPINNLVGVIEFAFNYYSLLPDPGQLAVDGGGFLVGGRAPAPVAAGGAEEITVGGFNLLRFFDTVNDPGISEPVLTATALNKRLGHTAEAICRYVQLPDVLGVVEVENLGVLTQLANQINAFGTAGTNGCARNPQYVASLVEGTDVGGIDVGFLVSTREVRSGVPRVAVVEVTQLGAAAVLNNPDGSTDLLNDRPPLLLRATFNHPDGGSEPLSIYINHMRSLSGVSDTAAGQNGWPSAGARVRAKRGAQAQFLAQLVHDRQVADPLERIVLLGDFNVFEFNDGLVDGMGIITGRTVPADQVLLPLTSPLATPLTVMTPLSPRNEQYSFAFDGNAQSLDHAIVNQQVFDRLRDVRTEHARINADFAEFRFGTGPLRTSDHDPVVLYMRVPAFRSVDLGVDAAAVAASIAAGGSAQFTVDVANPGASASDGATLRLVLDRALPGTSVIAPAGWTCAAPVVGASSTTIDCSATAVAAASSARFTLDAPTAASIGRVTIALAATLTGSNTDAVVANNADSASVVVTSNAAPVFTGTPTISGLASVGTTLSVIDAGTSDADGDTVTLAYEWLRDGTPISGATGATYVVTNADRGTAISARLTASDGTAQTVATTAAVVAPGNRAPVANDDSYSLPVDGVLEFGAPGVLGNDSDADGDALSAALVSAPASGTATLGTDGALRYQPNAGFVGDDILTYSACDTTGACATATVRIVVSANPTTFGTRDDRFVIAENAPGLHLDVVANDVIDAARRASGRLQLVQQASFGVATIDDAGTPTDASDDRVRYVPNADRSGEDLLSYRLCEGGASSRCSEALVQIVVRPLVDARTRLEIAGNGGFRDLVVDTYRAMSDARLTATPLVAPRVDEVVLDIDASPENPWDAGGRQTVLGTLPVGSEWRVLVDARSISGGSVDLYAGFDLDGDGLPSRGELRCTSAMSMAAERCELTVAPAATSPVRYWVMAHNTGAAGHTVRSERFEVPLIGGDGTLMATGPANAARLAPWPLRLAWNDPSLLDGESRAGYVALRSAEGSVPAWMPVRLDRRGGDAAPLPLAPGRAQALRLASGERQGRVFIDVPPGQTRLTLTVDTDSRVDLAVLRGPSALGQGAPPTIPVGSRNVIVRSETLVAGQRVLEFDAPPAGRWTVELTNASTGPASLRVLAALAGTAPVVRPGSFFNASRSGHGLFVYPAGSAWAGLWYTYLQDGTPTWYYLQDPAPSSTGVWRSRLYRSAWNGSRNTLTEVGSIVLTPSANDAFTFTHTVDGETGSEPMAALGRGCPTLGAAPLDASGLWFNPARAGSGYAVQLFPNYEFLSVFGYDGRGV